MYDGRRAMINLTDLETERTHRIQQQLEDDAGSLLLLLTVSGMTFNKYQLDQSGKTMDDVCHDDIVRKYVSVCLSVFDGLVVHTFCSINIVVLRRTRSTWMGDCLRTGKPSLYITNHPGQLSLPSLRGSKIEYRRAWLGLKWVNECVEWQTRNLYGKDGEFIDFPCHFGTVFMLFCLNNAFLK